MLYVHYFCWLPCRELWRQEAQWKLNELEPECRASGCGELLDELPYSILPVKRSRYLMLCDNKVDVKQMMSLKETDIFFCLQKRI